MSVYGNIILRESAQSIKEYNKLINFLKSKKEIYDCCSINNNSIILQLQKVSKQTGESLRDSFDTFSDYNNQILNFIDGLKSDSVIIIDDFGGDWDSNIKYSFTNEKGNPSYLSILKIIQELENKLAHKSGTLITGVSYTYYTSKTSKNIILKNFKENKESEICRFIMSKKNLQIKYSKILSEISKRYPEFDLRFKNEDSKDSYYKDKGGFDLVLYAKAKSFKDTEVNNTIIRIKDV